MKHLILALFLFGAITRTQCQTLDGNGFMHYDPLPYVPPPQVQTYQPPSYPVPITPSYPSPRNEAEDILSLFLIEDANINGHDVTANYTNTNAQIAIYKKYGRVNMSLYMVKANSQSFGEITNVQSNAIPATNTTYRSIVTTFDWYYRNTYNDDTGKAQVSITQVEKQDGIYYVCRVVSTYLTSIFEGRELK